jgi:hypothetical protein
MEHALVYCSYKRNGRDEVLVLDAGDGNKAHLHPGMNALPAELWDAARTGERAQLLLGQGVLVDKGKVAVPEDKEEAAPPSPVQPKVEVHAAPGQTPEGVAKAFSDRLTQVLDEAAQVEQA